MEFHLQDSVLYICLRFQHTSEFHGQEIAAAHIPVIWHTDAAGPGWIKAVWKQEPVSNL